MGIDIAELTVEQLPAIQQFCEAIDPQSVPKDHPELVLAARKGDTLVGVLLSRRDRAGVPTHRVVLAPADREGDLEQQLLSRAMGKLQMRGVHKYRIHDDPAADAEDTAAWQAMVWGAQPDLEGAANVVRVIGRY